MKCGSRVTNRIVDIFGKRILLNDVHRYLLKTVSINAIITKKRLWNFTGGQYGERFDTI